MRVLTFVAGLVGVAAILWVFWIATYPLAKKLGEILGVSFSSSARIVRKSREP